MAELKEELEIKRKNNSRNSGQTRKNKRVNKHHNNTFRKIDEICKNKKNEEIMTWNQPILMINKEDTVYE